MALILIATPGAPDANSYATVAQADAYHEAGLYAAAWHTASQGTKEQALVKATETLDAQCRWKGSASSHTQVLAWPRFDVADPNTGASLPWDTIPRLIVKATSELALALILGNRTADNAVEAMGLKRLQAGPVELEFKDLVVPKVLPDAVLAFLRDLTVSMGAARSVNVPLQRV